MEAGPPREIDLHGNDMKMKADVDAKLDIFCIMCYSAA